MDYKNTLNILKTDFEMKGNLVQKEPSTQKWWIDKQIYQKILLKNRYGKKWTLHDGPPYANGNIHVGHALNKIIKDVIVRFRNLQGFYAHYIPGWDTHGLPIEHALLSSGQNRDPKLTVTQKRDNCHAFATKYIELQRQQFARLGMLTDFKEIYCTYDNDYENRQLNLLLHAFKQKLIYRDLKPVYWSWSSQSALADAEVEYRNIKSPSIYVSFRVTNGKNVLTKDDQLLIWTTTPWTIPSNLAIAANPKFIYVRVKVNNDFYILSKARLTKIAEILSWEKYEIVKEINGTDLELIEYKHSIYHRTSPIILAAYVSNEDGTGLVHNSPGFGEDDYLACKKYGIAPFSPIDNLGKFTSEINDKTLIGLFYDDADKVIVEQLQKNHALLKLDYVNHSVAHDWRTKKPVIYRATKQWFIDIKRIQPQILQALTNVKFNNERNRRHIVEMMKNRTEWCISRQRVWGVPIPIIFDEHDEPIMDFELIKNIINIIKNETTNVWFAKPVEYFLTPKYQNQKHYRKETDIMDVWFDSGTSFTFITEKKLNFPTNLYFEGNDQYRGWFNSSLINGVIASNQAPYQMLLSHGMVLDEQGRKMSKSIGNVVDPLAVCNKFGTDVLRVWATNTDFEEDVRISENILNQTAEIYRRIRNTLFRFCLANISDFNYAENANLNFDEVDDFVLWQLHQNIKIINNAYEKYQFNTIVKAINAHVVELSGWYFDLIKDTLYCEKRDDPRRRCIQTVLYTILKSYLIFLTPIIPHTCEEVYKYLNLSSKQISVHLENWITNLPLPVKNVDQQKWSYFFAIKDAVYAKLETLRNDKIINKNNQARVELEFDNKFDFNEAALAKYLNIAKVKFINQKSSKITVNATDAKLIKCERCWNYYEPTQMHDQHICQRCHQVLSN